MLIYNKDNEQYSFKGLIMTGPLHPASSSGEGHVPLPGAGPSAAAKVASVFDKSLRATLHGTAPSSVDAGSLTISTEPHPELFALCNGCTLCVQQTGKTGVAVKDKPDAHDLVNLIVKGCNLHSIDPKSVVDFSVSFQREKMEITYNDAGTEKTIKIDLTKEMATWGKKDPATVSFKKMQEATTKLKGFEGRVLAGEYEVDARSPLVKTGSLGSRAAADITGPLNLGKIATKDFFGKAESRSDYLASKIYEACGTGTKPAVSCGKRLEVVKGYREKALVNLVRTIANKKKELTAAPDEASKEAIRKQIKDLETLLSFLSIQPMEAVSDDVLQGTVKAHVQGSQDFGVDLKVAIALMIQEQKASIERAAAVPGAPKPKLTMDQREKIAQNLEAIFLGRKALSAWERFKAKFNLSISQAPAVDSASIPMYLSKEEKERYQAEYKKSAKQMAADTVALLFNLEKDEPGLSVKEAYQQLSDRLHTSMQSRDVADLLFKTHDMTAPERAREYKTALNLASVSEADLARVLDFVQPEVVLRP